MHVSLVSLALVTGLGLVSARAGTEVVPLIRVHAHNDYVHTRPLLDALEQGFCSVEADIYLVEGQLLVAHDRNKVKTERSLQKLYLDPLQQRCQENGGRVYRGGPEFDLLIDIKGDWKATYPVLRHVLTGYKDLLSAFRDGSKETNALLVIITGNRSREMFAGESIRYAALDGDLADLDSSDSANLIPWISSNWAVSFKWRGTGSLADEEKTKLQGIVARAHQHGRRVRFWGAPDQPVFWQAMLDNGVDLLNTDDLKGARQFLQATPENPER